MGKTSSAVKDRYNRKAYDNIMVRVAKGKKMDIQAHAQAMGESTNSFIVRAIEEAMTRDGEKSE
ncbi:MAG: antitoxin [Clostridiales bacterium]|nr:antitoxin [Clostridiales bacterium]